MAADKPRDTATLEDFVIAGEAVSLTYHSLSMIEKVGTIEFPIFNVIDDYIDDLIALSQEATVSDENRYQYMYRPRLLCENLYGNGELYFIILLINGICNIKEFTLETGKIRLIKKDTLNQALRAIYKSEKIQIDEYNESGNS